MMTKLKFIVAFLSIFITVGIVNAASFDCKKAGTFIEHTICNDEKLSKFDDELAIAYKNAKQHTDKKALRKEQINWIKTKRAACKDLQCLYNTYSQRIKELNAFGGVNTNAKQITFDGIIKVCGDPAGKGYCVDNGKEKKMIIYFFECDSYQNLCNKLSNIKDNGTYSVTGKIDEYNYTFEKDIMIKKSTSKIETQKKSEAEGLAKETTKANLSRIIDAYLWIKQNGCIKTLPPNVKFGTFPLNEHALYKCATKPNGKLDFTVNVYTDNKFNTDNPAHVKPFVEAFSSEVGIPGKQLVQEGNCVIRKDGNAMCVYKFDDYTLVAQGLNGIGMFMVQVVER